MLAPHQLELLAPARDADIGIEAVNPGQAIGWVTRVGEEWIEPECSDRATVLHNGDGLCYYDLQKELSGVAVNRVERLGRGEGRRPAMLNQGARIPTEGAPMTFYRTRPAAARA